jgi:3-hydroxyacyl-CoA dehydrogenase
MHIRSVAILGAGTMGTQIAAHFANAGVPALLLDVTREAARAGLTRATQLKPDPFFTPVASELVSTGSFDDLSRIRSADWIIEAIVEQIAPKRALLARVDEHRTPTAIVSTNTSGIPVASIAEGRTDSFRAHWLGTHFFNPPRYLQLLEIIPTPETSPDVLDAIRGFADWRLGKGVVIAKDTPNFIANHLALFGVAAACRSVAAGEFTIEEVDAITGPAIGRPKSATFRTIDIAGIDVLAHVAANLTDRLPPASRDAFALPAFVHEMVHRGWTGVKTGLGFYKRNASGEILTLDPKTMEYRAWLPPRLGSIESTRATADAAGRLTALFGADDRAGLFLRTQLAPFLVYAARVTPDIAHGIDDVDRAMRWGFSWEQGPYEMWDLLGIDRVLAAAGVADAPPLVEDARRRGGFRPASKLKPAGPGLLVLSCARDAERVVRRNAGASLVDLGDGVLCCEFHSKMNAIGGDTLQMLQAGVKEAAANHRALVVGSEAVHFSAGANLMLLLLEAQEGNWEEIDLMVRTFQAATMALQASPVPVVAAPAGLAIGGGCEVVLHADRVQAAAEAYVGLVEVGVGLIPAGGGTKEMLVRTMEGATASTDALPFVQRVFETIGFGKVSTSGPDAKRLGYLRVADGITMNRERLIADAKAAALARVPGYAPTQPRTAIPVGGEGVQAALKLGVHLAWRAGRISDHDALIGRKLAWILSGGNLSHPSVLTEQQLLDLEREAFLSLCGERKTQERIAHTLKTGKTLRN